MPVPEEKTDSRVPAKRRLVIGRAPRTRSVLLATGMLVVGIVPFGIAATGDPLREGRRNGTTVNECYDVKPAAGKILLQTEGHEVFYRNFEIRPLR